MIKLFYQTLVRLFTLTDSPSKNSANTKQLFWGGIVPLAAYALIENYYGLIWGLVAGLALGGFEIAYEYFKKQKVSRITLYSNALLFSMGIISLITNDGIWFKLQPALLELIITCVLWGALLYKVNPILWLVKQQGLTWPEELQKFSWYFSFRLGLFFLIHAVLAAYAAIYWSTEAWVILKGIGLTLSLIVYFVVELFIQFKLRKR
jgi:intracellular septation protein